MPANEPTSTIHTNQISTNNLAAGQAPSTPAPVDDLYGKQGPDPAGTTPQAEQRMEQEAAADGDKGTQNEEVVWEARYSMKNFAGRLAVRSLLSIAWIALAIYTWEYNEDIAPLTIIVGIALLAFWAALIFRILQARYGHYYRLTTKRLFVSTDLMRRRRDQLELLYVKDVSTKQTLVQRWLSIGTVVVLAKEAAIQTCYLPGVDDPKRVMDLIWHCARAERDGRSVEINSL